MLAAMPVGTVTFLFSDIEGSTKMWEANRELMSAALARHDALIREAIGCHRGYVFKTVGDAFCAAFSTATDAVEAVVAAQSALNAEPWPEATTIRVRMALHTGAAETRDDDYFGPAVNRVARLLATGHGGQTLLSQTTYDLVRDFLPDSAGLRHLGEHRLKDLARPEAIFQLEHPDLDRTFPPLRSLSAQLNNLPQQLTRFIGRVKEIGDVGALMSTKRLLTLTGAGGSGKTRLSLQVAADAVDNFPDGVWFVDLAPLSDPGLVGHAISAVLQVKEERGKPISQTLVENLEQKRVLLILDNCEHLLEGCATLADGLIRQCRGVQILATSREALGISGEQAYRVPSLSMPDARQPQTLESLTQFEAVRLFIDRAALVRPEFQVTNRNAPALASVCSRLDGIPLALELASARVKSMSIEEIELNLDQRFQLLTGGSRTALPRQQTLRSLIDWSYDLLSLPEKLLLQRLSVFAGGWMLEAAAAVCSGADVDEGQVLDLLSSLCDKSLAVADQSGEKTRFRLLETVRQYARDRLAESDDGDEWRDRHFKYFVALAKEAEPHLRGASPRVGLEWIDGDHDNLRSAMDWCAEKPGHEESHLELVAAMSRFWIVRGHWGEARDRLAGALATPSTGPSAARSSALIGAGSIALMQGELADARLHYEASLSIRRELGDQKGAAICLTGLANVSSDQGDQAAARVLAGEALAIGRSIGVPEVIARALMSMGLSCTRDSDNRAAVAAYRESLSILREQPFPLSLAITLSNLGVALSELEGEAAARPYHEEALALKRELGDQRGIAYSLFDLGSAAQLRGDIDEADRLLTESLSVFRKLGERRGIATAMEQLASLAVSRGALSHAVSLWSATERLRGEIGAPLQATDKLDQDREIASARARLSDEAAFDRAWMTGRALTMDQAVDLALEDPAAD